MNPAEGLGARLRRGGAAGGWCTYASFAAVETMAQLGYDFLVLDMQHGEITAAHLPALFGAFPAGATPLPVVRAPQNDYHAINWLLDQGAAGVIVPMVNSPEDARRAVDAAKYPPIGRRSFGPFRAARYGAALEPYMAAGDSAVTLIVQVEDAAATRATDAILAVPGIDAVLMGPNDLAFSLLQPGQIMRGNAKEWSAFARTPEVLALCAFALQRAIEAGVPFGMTAASVEDGREWLARGASFVTWGSDFGFLRKGAEPLTGLRP